ncbi:tetratricopeptide repeat protein [Arenibacter sp. TNZ]|jgi:tetratricopeptide (TPR) repeat protein|uniref:tetratricopeptide repeat protein n=1 Tax=Arenibacter TaxID=178469 RepID=UPI000CD48EFC|nr:MULTISPECIES: tetratricopeptide repeat protein [Arenibacter]MCM4169943.1 tetratricopeptide repeat protein [Arenibacter sp. TNZ]
MKTKLSLLIIALALLPLVYYWTPEPTPEVLEVTQEASFYSMKCTVAKFLLSNVDTTQQIAPLFENLGNLHFGISTKDQKAQTYFDQGLKLTYAFNHAEAHRSFMEASRLDPKAAMAFWGQAYALGPNINDPMPDDERRTKSYEALNKARNKAQNATPKEKALIEALSHRYSDDLTKDIPTLNMAYMNAMEKVVSKFPEDADVQTLYAASVMNTMPWKYWDNIGNPAPNTLKGKAALERAMVLNPDHPGAHHYYIHMVELPKPDLAIPSADKLGSLMPAAGHIVHMPSHIYIRVGRYDDAVKANQAAILADEDYISQCYSQGMYPLGYYPHNLHFLWSAATLLGNSDIAIDAAKKTAEKVPIGEMITMPFLQDFASTPLLAYTRFGKWNEILTIPYPGDDYRHLKLIWHYARGIAFIRKNNIKEAKEELEALTLMKNDPELETVAANYTNPTSVIAQIAHSVVSGEIAAAEGNLAKAVEHLSKAIYLEDHLIYSEPTAWHIPVRQTLGAVLVKAEKFSEAEKLYKEDLEVLRQNGWSLMGLHQSLMGQGKLEEAKMIKQEFDTAWKHADIKISTSIL